MPQIQDVEAFNRDATELLRLMGFDPFWSNEDQFRGAVRGFLTSYLATRTKSPEERKAIADTYRLISSQLVYRATFHGKLDWLTPRQAAA